jgi:hypothetical protein
MAVDRGAGPFVSVANFCENVIEGKDGVLSLIRLIDRQMIVTQGPNAPEDMPKQQFRNYLVISLKAGAARGRHDLKLYREDPSGLRNLMQTFPVLFESEDRGQNVVLQLNMEVEDEGLYWFDIEINDQLLSRVPFRFIYQRVSNA